MKDYDTLLELSKQAKTLEGIGFLLEWDQEVYMPKGGAKARAEQIELMASLHHKQKSSPAYKQALAALIDLKSGEYKAKGLSSQQKAALREWRKDYLKDAALPNDFVKAFAKLTSESQIAWQEARNNDNFKAFAPYLERVIEMNRQKADYLGYEVSPYDALLDLFEPGMTSAELSPLFETLAPKLTDLLSKIVETKPIDRSCLMQEVPVEKQLAYGRVLLEAMGYDKAHGRLDLSTHPFSMSMHPTDNRVTTRCHTPSLFDSLSAVMHEGGHGLYEIGLDASQYGSPLCESISLGIHESQSRFWETRIGQSLPFWKHFYPSLQKAYGGHLLRVPLNTFYHAINAVNPSLIRVESDEVTYSLHVMVRYEIERQLIEGSMKVSDIPENWNFLMKTFLGVEPTSNREGCLQDIHWAMGAFGYFPTYALGNLYAAQMFKAFAKAHPKWASKVEGGELLFIKKWLHDHVHQYGRAYSAKELIYNISGEELSIDPYIDYLAEKYQGIYPFTMTV